MATTEERIRQLAADNVALEGRAEINLDANVDDLGVTSVAVVEFIKLVSQELNVELPAGDVARMKSLRDLINFINSKSD